MKRHLDEHELSAAVAGFELDAGAEEHLVSCVSCRRQVAGLQELLEARRQELEGEAPDWEQQRRQVMARLPESSAKPPTPARSWVRPLLAVAAVVVVAIGLGVLRSTPPTVEPGADPDLPIEQILAEVDAVLADESIPGFEVIEPGIEDAIYENGES